MISLLGLTIKKAEEYCKANEIKVDFVTYNSSNRIEDSGQEIVVRQRIIDNKNIQLVICKLQTDV